MIGRWTPEKEHLSMIVSNNVMVWGANGYAYRGSIDTGRMGPLNDIRFESNLWWGLGQNMKNAFDSVDFDTWLAKGMDKGSIIADPMFCNWQKGDWRLKPDSPARKIGFQEWDYEKSGVYGSEAWIDFAKSLEMPKFEAPPKPPMTVRRGGFATGFEVHAVNTFPDSVFKPGCRGKDMGWVRVCTKDARHGRQCLEVRDDENLLRSYYPHFFTWFNVTSDVFHVAFSLKYDKGTKMRATWRDYKIGGDITFADGITLMVENDKLRILSGGGLSKTIGLSDAGKWHDIDFVIRSGLGRTVFDVSVSDEFGERETCDDLVPCSPKFRCPRWLGFLSESEKGVSYFIDDYSCENTK